MVVVGQKLLYSGKSGCIRQKRLYSGKKCICIRAKWLIVFGQISAKLLFWSKVVVIGLKVVYWVVVFGLFSKVVVLLIGQKWLYIFGQKAWFY